MVAPRCGAKLGKFGHESRCCTRDGGEKIAGNLNGRCANHVKCRALTTEGNPCKMAQLKDEDRCRFHRDADKKGVDGLADCFGAIKLKEVVVIKGAAEVRIEKTTEVCGKVIKKGGKGGKA